MGNLENAITPLKYGFFAGIDYGRVCIRMKTPNDGTLLTEVDYGSPYSIRSLPNIPYSVLQIPSGLCSSWEWDFKDLLSQREDNSHPALVLVVG